MGSIPAPWALCPAREDSHRLGATLRPMSPLTPPCWLSTDRPTQTHPQQLPPLPPAAPLRPAVASGSPPHRAVSIWGEGLTEPRGFEVSPTPWRPHPICTLPRGGLEPTHPRVPLATRDSHQLLRIPLRAGLCRGCAGPGRTTSWGLPSRAVTFPLPCPAHRAPIPGPLSG